MEKLAQKRVSILSDKYNRGEQILLEDILEALGQEDVLAIEVMETVGHTLGKAMAGLINLFNPDLIVLGGRWPWPRIISCCRLRVPSINIRCNS